jgi:hypothetical protein
MENRITYRNIEKLDYDSVYLAEFIKDTYPQYELVSIGVVFNTPGFEKTNFVFTIKTGFGSLINGVIKYCSNVKKYTIYLLTDNSEVCIINESVMNCIFPTKNIDDSSKLIKFENILTILENKNVNNGGYDNWIIFMKRIISLCKKNIADNRINEINNKYNSISQKLMDYTFDQMIFMTIENTQHKFTFSMN